jgi:hypothetical protein
MGTVVRWPMRWDPSRELEEFGDRFNRIFGRYSGGRDLCVI